MDANKILELIFEHEEAMRTATRVSNYYYDEKRILGNNPDLYFSRKMINEAIEKIESTINYYSIRLDELYDEYHNLTGKDIIIHESIIHESNDGDTTTSKVRKDVIKSLKEGDSNE